MASLCSRMGGYTLVTAVGVGFLAYSSTHLYMCFCAPQGVMGFIQSLVIMDSTFCQFMMSIISHTQSLYSTMMIGLLFTLVTFIGKGINWMTDEEIGEVDSIQSRRLYRPSRKIETRSSAAL